MKLKESANMKRVKKLLQDIPENKRPFAIELYNELLFMQNTLADLKQQIHDEGAVDLFQQGKQKFLREHPALKAYNTTLQKYSLIYRQITDMLPGDHDEVIEHEDDELLNFVQDK